MVKIFLPKDPAVRTGLESIMARCLVRINELDPHNPTSQPMLLDAGYTGAMIRELLDNGVVNTGKIKREFQALHKVGGPPIDVSVYEAAEKFIADYCRAGVASHETQ